MCFREQRYEEGNVQFIFATINDSANLKLDSDIDLFKDQLSQIVLGILPSDVFHLIDHTNPREEYALRWMSAQCLKVESGLDFRPPYFVVPVK